MKRVQSESDPGQEWMLSFQNGNGEAFDLIVLHYNSGVLKFIGRYLADANRAEDLAQEAFLRVYRSRHRYQRATGPNCRNFD